MDQGYLDALTLEKCERIASDGPDNVLIAKDGEQVIGFCACGKCRDDELSDTGEIFAIYVLASYYGQGVGSALLQAGFAMLDFPQVAVWVLKGNDRAIQFYKKCGFCFDGREEKLTLGSTVTALRMLFRR